MKACPLMLQASLPSNGSDEELDRDDPFWEFIGETKKPQDDEEISDEEEEQKNEDDESAYDGDNDEDQDFLIF